jgi:hypothetical protein
MTSRFPTPWRSVELPNGFAVEDATGTQIGVFYGRAPDTAGHTGIMTMEEARQMALESQARSPRQRAGRMRDASSSSLPTSPRKRAARPRL